MFLGLERESFVARMLGEVCEGGDILLYEFVVIGIAFIILLLFGIWLCGMFLKALRIGPERKEEKQVRILKPSVNVLALRFPKTWLNEKALTKDDFAYEGIRKKDLR